MAFCPLRAPFGGIYSQGKPSVTMVSSLLDKAIEKMNQAGVSKFFLTLPPQIYQSSDDLLPDQLLVEKGFVLEYEDVNFHLEVQNRFRSRLKSSVKWKLNRLSRLGFVFKEEKAFDWNEVYAVLKESRERKGYTLSMAKDELENAFRQFPENYFLFTVRSGDKLAALAITVRVNPGILYIFYTADDAQFRKLSPVLQIHEGIFEFAVQGGYELLDLGTSSLQGILNPGVFVFKKSLGAEVSLKKSWSLDLLA